MQAFGSLAALPSFLAESDLAGGAFSSKARLEDTPRRHRQRCYLASHHYGVSPGPDQYERPQGSDRIVLEIAASLLQRGVWTLPTWKIETFLAKRARDELGWKIDAREPSASGDLRLRLKTKVSEAEFQNVLLTSQTEEEVDRTSILKSLHEKAGAGSQAEHRFIDDVASDLPAHLLCLLQPQRSAESMGLDSSVFRDQRVDFALETARGGRLVIEIDGSQHTEDPAQVHLDTHRDEALKRVGWRIWRIPTSALDSPESLRHQAREIARELDKTEVGPRRNKELAALFWSATAAARIQFLIIETVLSGAVPAKSSVMVSIREHQTDVAALADEDLNE